MHGISDPSQFKREMGNFANKFRGFDQHDSQEFLQYALEGVHSEIASKDAPDNNNNNNEEVRDLDFNACNLSDTVDSAYNIHGSPQGHFITKVSLNIMAIGYCGLLRLLQKRPL